MKYLTLLFLLIVACGPTKEDEIQALKDEVIGVHDEVMPKMSELRYARKSLIAQADSLVESDSIKAEMLKSLANDIGEANESMMQWMRNFKPDFEGTDEEVMQYFEDQKKSVQKVKEDMLSSLAKGEEMLED
ncbi:hypothetical protein [Ekhidna sp.]